MITPEDIVMRLPEGADYDSLERIQLRIDDAMDVLEIEMADAGRDLHYDIEKVPGFSKRVKIVVREMVTSMVLASGRRGIKSVSSSTGPTSDTTTYTDGDATGWATAFLTDELRALLGLGKQGARGRFPAPIRWPERSHYACP